MPTTIDQESPEQNRRAKLADLPPSAKLVHWILERKGPATQRQLADQALLPQRTVRSALDTLEAAELVQKELYIPDARKKVYHAEPVRTE